MKTAALKTGAQVLDFAVGHPTLDGCKNVRYEEITSPLLSFTQNRTQTARSPQAYRIHSNDLKRGRTMKDIIAAPEKNLADEHKHTNGHMLAEALKLMESQKGGTHNTADSHLPNFHLENRHTTDANSNSGTPKELNPSDSPKNTSQAKGLNPSETPPTKDGTPSAHPSDAPDAHAKPLQNKGWESQQQDPNFAKHISEMARVLRDQSNQAPGSDKDPSMPPHSKFDSPILNIADKNDSLDQLYTINLDGTISRGRKRVEPLDTWHTPTLPEQPAGAPAT